MGGTELLGERHRTEDLLRTLNPVERANAPENLYLLGDRSLLGLVPRVSIVGTRTPSPDGIKRARKLARELAENGIVVVSGLAKGIDAIAHRAAIDAGGRTIAVLGTPLDESYPAENRALQREIGEHHLLVSQFESGYPTTRTNFPRRNRTMALISHATVIVEAGEGSGSLSQGWEALRLGRELLILRSVVSAKELKWPAEMVKYGAQVLEKTSELLENLPPVFGAPIESLAF